MSAKLPKGVGEFQHSMNSNHMINYQIKYLMISDEMSEKMCYEISSTARGDEGTGIKGVVLANSCNTDSIQTVEFLIDTQSTAKRLECGNCPGDTICMANNHNDEPVYRCACLNTNAIQGTDGTCTFEN